MYDCIVIGGGPAGLTAAIYLARFHLAVRLYDRGGGRMASIPRTHNHAGFPGGIAGAELLERMQAQADEFGVERVAEPVVGLTVDGDGFRVQAGAITQARTVLLATGVRNRRPDMDRDEHDLAVERGLLRYCPICDGYEVTDRRVGVIGTGDHGMQEAIFLRGFTRDVTLIAPGAAHDLDDDCIAKLDADDIVRVDGPCTPVRIDGDRLAVDTADGPMWFDSVYPALGSDIHSELAVGAGAEASDEGCLTVDSHQRTSVPGLFAAGDVVQGLDQISSAMGMAGVAATAIRNLLAEREPLRR